MPLSEHEQRLLDQLEKQLNAEDPSFAHSMNNAQRPVAGGSFAPRNMVAGVLVFLLGLGIILAGVTSKLIVVGVVGFLVAVGGIYLATLPAKNSAPSAKATFGKTGKKQSGFMQGLEQKWDERKNGGR